MTSLFAVATLISSCTKDVEPEADNAAATIVTRAAGDTPAPTAYIEVNDTNPLNVLMYRNADNTPFFKITKVFAANINDNGSEPCLYLNDNVTEVLVPSAGSTTTGQYNYVQPIVASFIAVMIGQDTLSWQKVLSAVLVFTGVYLVTQSKSREDMEKGKR